LVQRSSDLLAIEAAEDHLKTISEPLSTAKADYSVSEGAAQARYIRGILIDMGFDPEGWTPIHEDNNACIEWGNNVIGGRERAKLIDIRKHIGNDGNQLAVVADVFTNSLQPAQFAACMSCIHRRRRKWGS
jgi:hypothetical protein